MNFISVPREIDPAATDIAVALEYTSDQKDNKILVAIIDETGTTYGLTEVSAPESSGVQLVFVPIEGGPLPGGITLSVVARIGPKSVRNDPTFRWTVDSTAMATYTGVEVTGSDEGEGEGEASAWDAGLTRIRLVFDADYTTIAGTNETAAAFKLLLREELVYGPVDFGLSQESIVGIILSEGSLIADVYIKDVHDDQNDDLYNYSPGGVAGLSILVEPVVAATSIKSNVTACDFCVVFEGELLCPHLQREESCPPIPAVCEGVACYNNRVCKPIPAAAHSEYIEERAATTQLSLGSGFFSSGSSETEPLDFTCACASNIRFGPDCGELAMVNGTEFLNVETVATPALELRDIAIIIAVSCIILVSTILLLHHFRAPVMRAKNAETAVLAELGAFPPFANMSHMNPDQELEWEEGMCDISGKPTAAALAKSRGLDNDSFALFANDGDLNLGQNANGRFSYLHDNRQRSDASSGVGSEKISNLLATTGALRGWNTEEDSEYGTNNRDSVDGGQLVWNDDGSIHGAPSTDYGSAADAISFTHFPQLSGPRSIHTVFTNPNSSGGDEVGSGLGASGLAVDEDGLPMGEEIDAVYQMARIQMMQNHEDRVDAVWDMAQEGERSHAILQETPDLDDDGMESPIFSPLAASPSTAIKDMTARHLGQGNGGGGGGGVAQERKPGINFTKLQTPVALQRATPEGFENSFSEHMHEDSELFSEGEGYSLIPGDQTQAVGRHNVTGQSTNSDGYAHIHGNVLSPFSDGGNESEDGEGYAMIEEDGPRRFASGMPVNSSPTTRRAVDDDSNIYETAVPGNRYNDMSGSSTVYETAAASKLAADHAAAALTVYQTAAARRTPTLYETASASLQHGGGGGSTMYETATAGRAMINMTQTRPAQGYSSPTSSYADSTVVYSTAGRSTGRPATEYEIAMAYDGPMYEAATRGPNYSVAMREQAKQGEAIYTRAAPSYKPTYPEPAYEIAGSAAGLDNASPAELLASLAPGGTAHVRMKSIKRYGPRGASMKHVVSSDDETVSYDPATVLATPRRLLMAGKTNAVNEYQTIDPNLQLTDSEASGLQDHDGDFSYDELTVASMDSTSQPSRLQIGVSPLSKKYEV